MNEIPRAEPSKREAAEQFELNFEAKSASEGKLETLDDAMHFLTHDHFKAEEFAKLPEDELKSMAQEMLHRLKNNPYGKYNPQKDRYRD